METVIVLDLRGFEGERESQYEEDSYGLCVFLMCFTDNSLRTFVHMYFE